jgi:hypothetical protein
MIPSSRQHCTINFISRQSNNNSGDVTLLRCTLQQPFQKNPASLLKLPTCCAALVLQKCTLCLLNEVKAILHAELTCYAVFKQIACSVQGRLMCCCSPANMFSATALLQATLAVATAGCCYSPRAMSEQKTKCLPCYILVNVRLCASSRAGQQTVCCHP